MISFKPTISKKLKLRETDVFSVSTRGIWENAHTNDTLAAIQAGENNPEETAYNLERLILDKTSKTDIVDNYTICFVFVDKLYIDPNAKKRRKKIIIISVISILLIAIIIILIVFFTRRRNRRREDMHIAFHAGVEFIHANNFIRALEEFQTAYRLAERLRDSRHRMDISNHRMLAESILHAEGLLTSRNYERAADAFGAAANRSRYAYNLAIIHIEAQRERATGYMNVHEFIFLGDILAEIEDWDNAESKYLLARNLAARLFYTDGRRLAIEALESLYRLREQALARQNEELQAEVIAQITAAELLIQGDNAFRDGDLIAARLFYQLARERFLEMGSYAIVASIDDRMVLTEQREERDERNLELAQDFIMVGDNFKEQGNYNEARRFFIMARDIFALLEEERELEDVQLRLDIVEIIIIGEATAPPPAPTPTPIPTPPPTPAPGRTVPSLPELDD
jgi:tetratricopeptide (TPR) repeat protein